MAQIKLDTKEMIRSAGKRMVYTNDELDVIQKWQSPGNDGISGDVNKALYKGTTDIPVQIAHAIDVLSNACSKSTTSFEFTVFRGENDHDGFMKQGNDDAWKGKILEKKGFLSTSLSKPFGRPVQFVIKVPKGTQGMFIGHLAKSQCSGDFEDEFLIQKGYKLKIDHIERKNNYPVVFAELII